MSRTVWDLEESQAPSVWVGSLVVDPPGKPVWSKRAPKKLREAMEREGRPFVLVGRNSSSSGRRGCLAAATDLHEAAETLAELLGLDLRPVLPPIKVLAEALFTRGQVQRSVARVSVSKGSKGSKKPKKSKVYKQQAEGPSRREEVPFINRYMAVYLPAVNVVLSLSAGTSVKLDRSLNQPHAHWWLRPLVMELEPTVAGLFAKRLDRITRSKHGHFGLWAQLEDLSKDEYLWVGDGDMGRWKFNNKTGFFNRLCARAEQAENAASELDGKSKQALRRLTHRTMAEGRLSCPKGSLCPPGFFRYRLAEDSTTTSIMNLDHPDWYPDPKLVRTLLPDIRDASGERVNQVALTIEALEHLAAPGATLPVDVFVDLAERGLSSERWRKNHWQSARFLDPDVEDTRPVADRARMYFNRLGQYLSVYEFGLLEVDLGRGEVIEVTNLLPPAERKGEWLKSWVPRECFDDIRATLLGFRGQQWRQPKRIQMSWAGLPVKLDGIDATMRQVERTSLQVEELGPGLDWQVQPLTSEDRPDGFRRPRIADTAFTASLVEALFGADLTSLELANPSSNAVSERTALVLERDALRAEAKKIEASQKILARAISARQQEGKRRSSSLEALLAEMDETDELWDTRQVELAVVERRILGKSDEPRVAVSELELLVEGLRNPEANGYRNLLRRGIKDLRFTETRVRVPTMSGVETTWAGNLVLEQPAAEAGAPSSLVQLPFSGSVVVGNVVHAQQRVAQAAELLRAGEVARNSESSLKYLRDVVAKAFGMQGRFVPALCGDSTLTRMWMAILCPEPLPGETRPAPTVAEIAADPVVIERFGGPEAVSRLVERMQSLAASKPRTWRIPRGERETRLILAASRFRAEFATGTTSDPTDQPGQLDAPGLDRNGLVDLAGLKVNVRAANRAHRWTFSRGRMAMFAPCEFCGHDVATLLRNIEAMDYVCLGCRRDENGVMWDHAFDVQMAGVPLLTAAGYDLAVPDGHDGADVVIGTSASIVEAKRAHYRPYEELEEDIRSTVIGAYAAGTPSHQIRKEQRVTQEAMMRCVDEAGLKRRRPDIPPRTR